MRLEQQGDFTWLFRGSYTRVRGVSALSAMNRFQFRGITLGALALTSALAHPFPSPQAGLVGAHHAPPKVTAVRKASQPNKADLVSKSKSGLFVQNSGQWNSKAISHAHAGGLDYWVTREGVVMDFNVLSKSHKATTRKGHVIEMKFDGAHKPVVAYTGKAKVKTDYLVSKSSHPFHADSFAEVHLDELYPGVEMRNYFDEKRPRYDLVVKPGGDPSKIKLSFNGQTKLSIDKAGNLVMGTSLGDMSQAGLKAFTVSHGKTTPVKAAFRVHPGNKVTFDLGAYDHKAKLVVDPLIYGSLFGGDSGRDCIYGVTSTPDGGVYMTGWTESVAFPVLQGAYQINLTGGRNAFVTLFRGDAYDVVYNSYIGGSTAYVGSAALDEGHFIQISPDGTELWIAGTTTSSDFPLVSGSSYMPAPLNTNVINSFFVEFQIDPTAFLIPQYATYFGPDSGATSYDLRGFVLSPVDGSLLVAGTVNGTIASADSVNTPVGPGTKDVFLTKLDPTGATVLNSRYFGGSQDDSVTGLATDPDGDFVISGTVISPATSTGQQQLDLTANPSYFETGNVSWANSQILRGYDLYAAKIRSDSSMATYWSGVVGGSLDDLSAGYNDSNYTSQYYDFTNTLSNSVATDVNGNVYILGESSSFNYPRTSNVIGEQNRKGTCVVSAIAADGSSFLYSSGLNTSGAAVPVGIAVDAAGNATITGLVQTSMLFIYTGTPPNPIVPNGDAGQGAIQVTNDALRKTYTWEGASTNADIPTDDAWINVINTTATQLLYGSYIGGDGNDTISYPFVDQFGDIWVFGEHDNYYGYVVFPWLPTPPPTTLPQPKLVSFYTPFPTGFLSPLAFKVNPDEPGALPVDPRGSGGTNWTSDYDPPYVNPTPGAPAPLGTVPVWEYTDGYVLRFRIALPTVASVTLTPNTVPGGLGAGSTGVVTLSSAAPAQGADVIVTINSNRAAAQFAGGTAPYSFTVIIPAGATTGSFALTTNPVLASTPVTIEANYAGNITFNTLTVVPWLQQFSLTPTTVVGGNNVTATVTLSATAIGLGVPVTVTVDDPTGISQPLPITFTVPAGTTAFTTKISTALVTTQKTINLTATVLGVSQKAALTLTPLSIGISSLTFDQNPINAAGTATGTITLSTPAPDAGLSVTVSSSDSGIAFFKSAKTTLNPYPSTITVSIPANSLTGTFVVDAGTLADTSVATITAATSTSSVTAPLTVNQVTFTTSITPTSLAGGATATGTITLAAPTTQNALTLTVTPSDTTVVPAISDVTIPANGFKSGTFSAPTTKVLVGENVTIDIVLGEIVPEDVPVTLSVNAASITSFKFRQSVIRSGKSDVGLVTLDGTVPQDVTIDITYGTGATTAAGAIYFFPYTGSVLVHSGKNVSDPVTVTAKRFTRPIVVPIQATIHGSTSSASTSITINR